MRLSRRVKNLPPYLFVEISRKIAEEKRGVRMLLVLVSATRISLRRRISSNDSAKRRMNRLIIVTLNPKDYRN